MLWYLWFFVEMYLSSAMRTDNNIPFIAPYF